MPSGDTQIIEGCVIKAVAQPDHGVFGPGELFLKLDDPERTTIRLDDFPYRINRGERVRLTRATDGWVMLVEILDEDGNPVFQAARSNQIAKELLKPWFP